MRVQSIKRALFEKPYMFFFLISFFLYIALNIFINDLLVTLRTGIVPWFLILFLLFNFLIVPSLVGITISLSAIKLKEATLIAKNKNSSGGIFTLFGTFLGVLGGACPGCFVGLFPAFLGIFGITATLQVLPLLGLEIQILASLLLLLAIYLLTRPTVCKVPFAGEK